MAKNEKKENKEQIEEKQIKVVKKSFINMDMAQVVLLDMFMALVRKS